MTMNTMKISDRSKGAGIRVQINEVINDSLLPRRAAALFMPATFILLAGCGSGSLRAALTRP